MYNFYKDDYIICYFATQLELLYKIHDWIRYSYNKSIF